MLAEQRIAFEAAQVEDLQDIIQQVGEAPTFHLKTFIVKMGIAWLGVFNRESFQWSLVQGYHLASAIKAAWHSYSFDPDSCFDSRGDWIEFHGVLAFRIKSESTNPEACCVFWITQITELPPDHEAVLRNYLE